MRFNLFFRFLLIPAIIILHTISSYSQVPYVPTPEPVVEKMLEVARVTDKDVVYDLGCGDGRIVVRAAKKYGARAIGIDNNPERIKESWENAGKNGLSSPQVDFRLQDLFKTNLRDASVVTLYLLTNLNVKLRPKLFQELKPGTRIVSHSFSMENWEPDSLLSVEGRYIYYWTIPVNASGTWDISLDGGKKGEKNSLRIDQVFQKVDGSVQMGEDNYYLTSSNLDSGKLTFSVNSNRSAKSGNMKLTAQVREDRMQGTFDMGNGEKPVSFTATRRPGTMQPLDPTIPHPGR